MNRKRWLYLCVGIIGLLMVGVIYAWSIMKAPLEKEFGWSGSQLALNYTITVCFFCLGSMLAGVLSKRLSEKLLIFVGGILLFIGFFSTSRLTDGDIHKLYFWYGIIAGLGIGMVYNSLISAITAWFPDRKGFCSGALMMGFGASTMVIGQISSVLFDMNSIGWRNTFSGIGIVSLGVLTVCSWLVRRPNEKDILPKIKVRRNNGQDEGIQLECSARETMKQPTFWLFYAYGSFGAAVGSSVISFARDFAINAGATVALATILVGALSICNGLGRILCGFIFDIVGRKNTMTLIVAITVAAPVMMILAVLNQSIPLIFIAFCLTGISFGSYPTVSAAFISSFFGNKDFSINYSVSNSKMLISACGAMAASALFSSTGSYVAPLIMMILFGIIAFGLNFTIKHPTEKKQKEDSFVA